MDNNTMNNVLGVCSFLGTAGYNYHSRGFFTALNKYIPVGIRNWSGDSDPYYLTDEQKAMMAASQGGSFSFGNCITICLHETNHEDWYKHDYKSPKIAFNVWESTRQPDGFFKKMLEFDQIWVPSTWQAECTIQQGAPADKVFVIPEGIDTKRFNINTPVSVKKFTTPGKFSFLIVGRWEYRKATTEMIKTFLNTFATIDNVELLLLVDNPFDRQKLTTEDKINKNGFTLGVETGKIKILHKLSQNDYDYLMREVDCFVSCSRAEGWNLPLQEFMAVGTPTICSNWSAQTDFASEYSNLVNIKCLKPAWSEFGDFPGEYGEPDFNQLGRVMIDMYYKYATNNFSIYKDKALKGAEAMSHYTWDNAAQIAMKALESLEGFKRPLTVKVIKEESTHSPVFEAKDSLDEIIGGVSVPVNRDKKIRSKDIFVIDCYPNSIQKKDMLIHTIVSVKKYDKPIAVVSHYPLGKDVIQLVDYYIYDADNTLPDYRLPVLYTFDHLKLSGRLDRPYHCLPIIKSLQNICKVFSNYEHIHFIEYDINVNLDKHLDNVNTHKDKEFVGYYYEGTGVYTNIMSFKPSMMLGMLTNRTITWEDYKRMATPLLWEQDLIFENWVYRIITNSGKINDTVILQTSSIDMKKDYFKEIPTVNYVFSQLDTEDYILFITHTGRKSSEFKVTLADCECSLVDCGDLSYCIFTTDCKTISIQGSGFNKTLEIPTIPEGEFVFYDRELKCKKLDRLRDFSNREHNVQIKNFFVDGAFMELVGPSTDQKFDVSFTDRVTGQIVHNATIGINNWTKTNRKYFTDWNVKVKVNGTDEVLYDRDISYFKRRVFIVLDSKAMGDTLAWFPMVEEFRKKHNAQVIVSTFWNKLFQKSYPDLIFVEPGNIVPDIFAQFFIGCFDGDLHKNKFNWRITPLQKLAADILGIDWVDTPPNISYDIMPRPITEKYVAISEHSTFLSKYWLNPNGWNTVIKYLNSKGYKVAAISKENSQLEGVIDLTNRPIEESMSNIHHADLFIGMSSGPSWLAWAMRKPLVLISGYSTKWAEMDYENNSLVSRIINEKVCNGCFNDPSLPLERGNWRWCPRSRDFECTKMISADMVIAAINEQLGL